MTVRMIVGYDRRTWVTYEIADATDEEVAILENDDAASLDLARSMEEAGRLTDVGGDADDNPEIFHESVDSSIIDVTKEDE